VLHLLITVSLVGQLGWRAGTPSPVLDGDPDLVAMYWQVWENYRGGVLEEAEGGLPTPIYAPGKRLSAAESVTGCFFTRWAWRASGAPQGMDAYLQLMDRVGALPQFWMLSDGSPVGEQQRPLFASWAAWNLYRSSGDGALLQRIFSSLARVHSRQSSRYLDEEGRRRLNAETTLFPQIAALSIEGNAEIPAVLLIEATYMAKCAQALGNTQAAAAYRREAIKQANLLAKTWSDIDGLFYVRGDDGNAIEPATIIPLLSVCAKHAELPPSSIIVGTLSRSDAFRTPLPYPIVARSDANFSGESGAKPMFQYLMLRALIEAGERDAAGYACDSMLRGILRSWRREQQFYDEYGPVTLAPSPNAKPSFFDAGYLVIAGLIEAVMGFDVDAPSQTVDWHLRRTDRHGIERSRFGSNTITLICRERESATSLPTIEVSAEKPFTLHLTVSGRKLTKKFPAGETIYAPR
jgi:hypothetical protein